MTRKRQRCEEQCRDDNGSSLSLDAEELSSLRPMKFLKRSLVFVSLFVLLVCGAREPEPGTVLDEAARANLLPEHVTAATEVHFHDMDYNLVQ